MPEVLGDYLQRDAVVQPRVAVLLVIVVRDVAEVEAQVREVLTFFWERGSAERRGVVGDLAELGHAFHDADVRVGLPPAEVGHSDREGGGMFAEVRACFEVGDESVCSLEDGQGSESGFFERFCVEVHVAVEDRFGERLESVGQDDNRR